jgi:hypothetical protein
MGRNLSRLDRPAKLTGARLGLQNENTNQTAEDNANAAHEGQFFCRGGNGRSPTRSTDPPQYLKILIAGVVTKRDGGTGDNISVRPALRLGGVHGVAVDQRDLSLGLIIHSVDAASRDEVAGLHDKVLHQNSIQNEREHGLKAKSLRRGLVEGLSRMKIYYCWESPQNHK